MGRGSYLGGGTLIGWSNPNAVLFRAKKQSRGCPAKPKPRPKPRAPLLSKGEINQHFKTALRSKERVLDDLVPSVLANVKAGAKSPSAMAAALNRQGLRTALDASWKPQLAKHLMDLTFERVRASTQTTWKPPVDPTRRAKAQTPSLALESMAAKRAQQRSD